MTNQILSARLDRDINIEFQSFEQNASRPGIINHDDGFWRDASDRTNNARNIMYFHGNRTGGFQKYDFRVRLNMLRDISADERVEPACRHAQFAENFAAEILAGFIGCVGHQDVVALLNECQNGVGNRRRAAREERASGAAFQFTHGFLERKVGQRSPASVK
ncbi:Uncharacterised protein [Salmonella enterica subsp. enterica serovar Bovismorbificans]|nr:Uncharacterised protein [Salmonella enterica subsp. enterica serovar Bovismorbificans]